MSLLPNMYLLHIIYEFLSYLFGLMCRDDVYKGKVPGTYAESKDCHKQVNKFSGNNYKGYPTKE
jgi:hypothetical protein